MSPREWFAWFDALPLLLAVPVAWFLLYVLDRKRARRLEGCAGPRAGALAADLGLKQRCIRRRLVVAGLFLALVAVLQPFWGEGPRKTPQRGVDLLLCLDVSRSMLARDLAPNRLARAQGDIRALASRVRGDRLGLVAFAGDARLVAPLTRDMVSFTELLEQTGPLSVERGGTNLGAALETALSALEGSFGGHEAVVLLTDGEDLAAQGLRAAEPLKERHINVYCVGYGSERGSKIALQGPMGESFLLDRSGREVVSAMDPGSLRRIAESTGGEFMDAGIRPHPLADLYEKSILRKAYPSFEDKERRERKNRFQWPLLGAFLLWVLEICLTDRKA